MLVIILHPEQWNGGSDRCIIGMMKHFVSKGYQVIWYTTMIDSYWNTEIFENVEIRNVRLPLHPGDWWTQNVVLAWRLIFSGLEPDLIVIDHSASCLPVLKWRFPRVKILFYCHFPQQLVAPTRFFLYRWYSHLISIMESFLFQSADVIMVNSNFTIILKRNSNLIPRIILAGSVMPHIPESRIYYHFLRKLVRDAEVEDIVEFVTSPTDFEKFALYRECDSVLYTPPNEHFGIVPIEALEQRRPVIVCNSGGPAETVLEGITGSKNQLYLQIDAPNEKLLADAMDAHMKRYSWPALDNDEIYKLQVSFLHILRFIKLFCHFYN
ncbi:unnamed protein product [Thelazia callipaeda]|uniref:Alpha-1,3/1,6-mannosyltransferase ALG2 n=1 Tax=Thelazia callipaeda TaxID=103827 RepID=A0A0N5DB95_THECL|nr:unnamed protein product [Thelazia callipaeda]